MNVQHDPCVANKLVKGQQQMIRFHVDNIMSSHVDKRVNDDFLKSLNLKYGQYAPVTATQGSVHTYLGMKLIYHDQKFECNMTEYIGNMLEEFPVKFDDKDYVASTTQNDMFSKGSGKILEDEKRELFHRTVAQNLFVSKRGRQDI